MLEALQHSFDQIEQRLRSLAKDLADNQSSFEEGAWPDASHLPLRNLVAAFALSRFEAWLLLFILSVEISPNIASLCAEVLGCKQSAFACFRLAIAIFPNSDWRVYMNDGSLRRWDLVRIDTSVSLLCAPLRLTEFTMRWLCDAPGRGLLLSKALTPILQDQAIRLSPIQHDITRRIIRLTQLAKRGGRVALALICDDRADAEACAAAVAAALGLHADLLHLDSVPEADRQTLLRQLERERRLMPGLLLVDAAEAETPQAQSFLRRLLGIVIVASPDRPARSWTGSPSFVLPPPTREEQLACWRVRLGRAAKPLESMLGRYDLRLGAIDSAFRTAAAAREAAGKRKPAWRAVLSEACREQLRGPLDAFADRIQSRVALDDLVLPALQREQLEAIIADATHQPQVMAAWRRGGGSARGLGLTVLFSGPSGTGKTTAAEALACALDLDLYRIDLSAVVSKYIGETEKQLAKVFDAAERGANLLLFDEGDALFGKRTEVRDSHDRYANQEISFLLQKLESYKGIAVLTSNLADSLDSAFLRRFRYVVAFPLPGPAQREAIWACVFGPGIRTETLDAARLSRMNLSGGSIRNVALKAAFLAAAEGGVVTMAMIYRAAEEEYRKLRRVMTEDERRG